MKWSAMQCSWKTVILLAFTSIAIQYTAIRTLTSKPFPLCQLRSPQNCSLGDQDREPTFERGAAGGGGGGGGCDDPNFSLNTTRKTHVLILAATRTGSSFLGQLLNQHPEVFYLFEPLYHVQNTLIPRLPQIRTADDRLVMLGASRDLLRSLYGCDLYSLQNYIKPIPKNHSTYRLFRRGTSRVLCHQPVCDAFGPDLEVEEGDCVNKCGPLNMTLASEACREMQYVVIKTVRMGDIRNVQALVEDPRLNVKVIQLVRDPRGVLSSRIETFGDPYRLWRIWRETGRRPYNVDFSPITGVCEDFFSSVSTGLSHPDWLRGKYMLVRYEDLAKNPFLKTKEIYKFLGLSMDKNLEDWIIKHTRGSSEPAAKHKYGTVRDSAANAESWRLKLSYDIVEYTQTICRKALHQLGYKTAKSAEELKNVSLSLVEDKTFLPFL